jgi:hypothetical protein
MIHCMDYIAYMATEGGDLSIRRSVDGTTTLRGDLVLASKE